MKGREIVIGVIILLAGVAIGFFAANSLNRTSVSQQTSTSIAVSGRGNITVPANATQADVTATLEKANAEPDNFAAQMKAGDMYAQIGRFEDAVEFYKRGVVINPSSFKANVVLANALFDSQKFEEAEGYYAKALQIEPNNVDARTDLGATFVERSNPDYDRAITEFQKARQLDPRHAPSLYYLGIATLRKGDKTSSATILSDLEKLSPGSELVGKLKQNIDAK